MHFLHIKGFYEPSQTTQRPPELASPLFSESIFVFIVQTVDLEWWFQVGHFDEGRPYPLPQENWHVQG